MKEWKTGHLHSGSKKGPVVTSQKQAVAIALSEQDQHGKGGKGHASHSKSSGGRRK